MILHGWWNNAPCFILPGVTLIGTMPCMTVVPAKTRRPALVAFGEIEFALAEHGTTFGTDDDGKTTATSHRALAEVVREGVTSPPHPATTLALRAAAPAGEAA